MAAFSIEERTEGPVTVVRITGSADLGAQAQLEREVTRLSSSLHPLVVLDLEHLTFIASLAVGQLVVLESAVRRRGGKVRVASPSESVHDVLLRCRLTERLPVYASVKEAVEAPVG